MGAGARSRLRISMIGSDHRDPVIMPFESFDEAARFGGGKSFVERRSRVRAESVLHQNDLVGAGKMHVGQILERVGVIGRPRAGR